MGPEMQVAAVGDLNIDLISQPLSDFPRKEASTIIDYYVLMVGGCAANFAAATSSLGLPTRFLGLLGDDAMSDWLVAEMERYGVEVRVRRKPEMTCGITLAFAFEDGKRSYLATLGSNRELQLEDLDLSLLEGVDHVHRSGYWWSDQMVGEATAQVLRYAKEHGSHTSLDIGWDYKGWSSDRVQSVFTALRHVDLFFANRDEVEKLTGQSDPIEGAKELLEAGPEMIALHLGKSGSAVVTGDGITLAEPHDVEVVNPTGTGDVFNASFVYGLVKGWDIQKVVDFAVGSAEVHIQRKDRSFPTLDKVESFMDELRRTTHRGS
jgi:sugar/nucleoside kinase (ribokinase family)